MADNKELREALLKCCKRLRLSSNLAEKAFAQEGETNQEYLLNLLKSEIEYRDNLRITKYMNAAAFPTLYTKEQYKTEEIVFPDGVTFQSLLGLDFYHKGKNFVMYGSTGTGKTMLSILIGMSACKKGIPVRFYFKHFNKECASPCPVLIEKNSQFFTLPLYSSYVSLFKAT